MIIGTGAEMIAGICLAVGIGILISKIQRLLRK